MQKSCFIYISWFGFKINAFHYLSPANLIRYVYWNFRLFSFRYIFLIYSPLLSVLLSLCRIIKTDFVVSLQNLSFKQVKWSGVRTQHSTTPFVDEMYKRLNETIQDYQVIISRWPEYIFVLESVSLAVPWCLLILMLGLWKYCLYIPLQVISVQLNWIYGVNLEWKGWHWLCFI